MDSKDPDRASTRERFDEIAAGYDTQFVRFIGKYDEMQSMVFALVSHLGAGGGRVLDLGTGTGELSRILLENLPSARVHGVDFSEKMLEQARRKLARFGPRFTTETADLATYSPPASERFDLIVSVLAIHHLTDSDKADLTARCHAAIVPGGFFINADLIKGASPRENDLLDRFHLEEMRSRGLGEEEIQQRVARHRQHDIPATLPDQIHWVTSAGFREVWVPWRYLYQAIIVCLR
ncbi:MAG: class I SAM-dependent methyltransferase [Acidobacteriota bacterium]